MTLSIISEKAGPVSSTSPASSQNKIRSSMIATHTLQDAPRLNLLMVPGGTGSESWMEQFISARLDETDYIASVCTGAQNLAKAGVLNGKRATTNKFAWASVVQYGENVTWVPSARWVHDGKVWTSSGVAAGIDMTYALLSWMYGSDRLNATMNRIELSPHTDEHWDPYSVVHKVSNRTSLAE
jgi:transcriptional regulator GlxA family with amidase domain